MADINEDEVERWGFMTDRQQQQQPTAHALEGDNSPLCGARYYSSLGASSDVDESVKCRTCLRIQRRKASGDAKEGK